MNNPETLETEVADSLRTLLERYRQLKVLTDKLVLGGYSPAEFQAQLNLIQSERKSIEALQQHSKLRYDEYIAINQHASEVVRELTSAVTDLIQNLIANFDQLEAETRKSQAKLQPQVNENLRAAQMKSAYARRTV